MAYSNIKNAGYTKTIAENGLARHKVKKTWSNFKAHFAWSFKETQILSRNSNTKGCAAHEHSAQANAALFTEMQQDHTLALANIATATQADRTSVALLTRTISELASQVADLTEKLATSQAKNARIKKSGHQSIMAGHGHRSSSNSNPLDPTSSQDQNVYYRSGQRLEPNGYCSSHGYKVEESHMSVTCRFPSNGHNKSATLLDIKGGKTCNKEWINGGPTE